MALHPLPWLLRLAALCQLVLLLTGQQHGSNKCSHTCNRMTTEIPQTRLDGYRQTEASCGKRAIILTTRKNRKFCADPEESWVQEAIKYLDRKAGPFFEKQERPRITPTITTAATATATTTTTAATTTATTTAVATATTTASAAATTTATTTASAAATTTATATATTATSWQSSYQPRADLWAGGKASEAASTQWSAPSTQALPTGPPSTQAGSIQNPPTDIPSSQTPSPQALPTGPPSTQASSTQAPSTEALPTDPPSTQAASPQAATTAPTAPGPVQDPTPESPLGSRSAHPAAVTEPGSRPRVSAASSKEPGSSDSQRQDVLSAPEATRRQAVGLLAFLGLLFCLGVATLAYQRLQACPRGAVGDMVEGLRYVPCSRGSNSYVLVPV